MARRTRPKHPAAPGVLAQVLDTRLQTMTLTHAAVASGVNAALLSQLRTGTYPYLLSMPNVRRLARWLGWSVLATMRACDAGISPTHLSQSVYRAGLTSSPH